jgi:hypothetical protein
MQCFLQGLEMSLEKGAGKKRALALMKNPLRDIMHRMYTMRQKPKSTRLTVKQFNKTTISHLFNKQPNQNIS